MLLTAEQSGDHAASYRLLSAAGRKQYKDLAEWVSRRTELPVVTGFDFEAEKKPGVVTFLVRHKAALDPFIGLSAAEEHQTWTGVKSTGGWLLNAEPAVEYVTPPEAEAQSSALAWAKAVQACDQNAAKQQQAGTDLFGGSVLIAKLCGSAVELTAGKVGPLEAGPATSDLVAQYSSDALVWGRVVPITGPGGIFHVELAPLGKMWKVVGAFD